MEKPHSKDRKSEWKLSVANHFLPVLIAVFFIVMFTLASSGIVRADLSCNVTSSCSATSVLGIKNDTGGFVNAHAQLPSNTSYSNVFCCSSTGQTVGTSCTAWGTAPLLRLSNVTDAHVQDPNNNSISPIYPNRTCISGEGTARCTLTAGACQAGYTCLGSIASTGSVNYTNAHVGNCSYYSLKICCTLNSPPTQGTPILNSTYGTNTTAENLTVYNTSGAEADGDGWNFTYDWRNKGQSIAVLSMSFNTNITNYSGAYVRDHSTFGNNGTLGGGDPNLAPEWASQGVVGGTYGFDGTDDFISVVNSNSINFTTKLTLSVWIYPTDSSGEYDRVIAKAYDLDVDPFSIWGIIRTASTDDYDFCIGVADLSGPNCTADVVAPQGIWTHIVGQYNGTHVLIYVNGTLSNTTFVGSNLPILYNTQNVTIAANSYGREYFNGFIDEIYLYNRTLSAVEVMNLYQLGHNKLLSQELRTGDNWTVAVTPSDGIDDGATRLSNSVVIRSNSVPGAVALIAPNETITERYPTFNWTTASDTENDVITYDINVTPPSGLGCFGFLTAGITTNYTVSTTELCTDLDHSSGSYIWSVRACDAGGCSIWSNTTIFNISSVNAILLLNNTVNFGNTDPGASNNTTTNNPRPFLIENDGNIRINISARANDSLFDSVPNLNDSSFQFMSGVNESNAFNLTRSLTSFTNVTNTSQVIVATMLYLPTTDAAEIDFKITVPGFEPVGSKNSLMIVQSSADLPS